MKSLKQRAMIEMLKAITIGIVSGVVMYMIFTTLPIFVIGCGIAVVAMFYALNLMYEIILNNLKTKDQLSSLNKD